MARLVNTPNRVELRPRQSDKPSVLLVLLGPRQPEALLSAKLTLVQRGINIEKPDEVPKLRARVVSMHHGANQGHGKRDDCRVIVQLLFHCIS
jgi:hypothetical protein